MRATIPFELVQGAADADLPARCWRHDQPAIRIQRLYLDNYNRAIWTAWNNWREIRWPVCEMCRVAHRRARVRGLLAVAVWMGYVAALLAIVAHVDSLLLVLGFGYCALFSLAVVAMHRSFWSKVIGIRAADRVFWALELDVAPDTYDRWDDEVDDGITLRPLEAAARAALDHCLAEQARR